jgi:hypothetical protein
MAILRIWSDAGGVETLYDVPLESPLGYATPVGGSFISANAVFQLGGVPTVGDYIELAWLDQQFNYLLTDNDTLESASRLWLERSTSLATAPSAHQRTRHRSPYLCRKLWCKRESNWRVRDGVGAGTETWSPGLGACLAAGPPRNSGK